MQDTERDEVGAWAEGPGPVLRRLGALYADLSDGQRWTISLTIALVVVFVAFSLRQPRESSAGDVLPTLPQQSSARVRCLHEGCPSPHPRPARQSRSWFVSRYFTPDADLYNTARTKFAISAWKIHQFDIIL